MLTQMTEVEKQLSELEIREAEVAQRYTAEHPTMVTIREQLAAVPQDNLALLLGIVLVGKYLLAAGKRST